LVFEEAIMPIVQGNGKQISYVTGREGIRKGLRTMVFIHGSGGSRLHWNYQRQFFEKSYNVVIVDLPGHGEARSEGEDSVGAYAGHLLRLLRALPGDVFCLLGHSLGGAIVQEFTLLYPQYVEALVLLGTGARLRVLPEILEGIRKRFEETVRLICDYAFSKRAPVDLMQKGIEAMLETSKTVLYGDFAACNGFDIMDRVENIRAPTLVICGNDDLLTPPKYAQFLAEKIGGARLEIIDGAGHMVMIEKPDEFNSRVMTFLQTLSES
jgi:pimeloyl-ACP methyl ester carboxylesterase